MCSSLVEPITPICHVILEPNMFCGKSARESSQTVKHQDEAMLQNSAGRIGCGVAHFSVFKYTTYARRQSLKIVATQGSDQGWLSRQSYENGLGTPMAMCQETAELYGDHQSPRESRVMRRHLIPLGHEGHFKQACACGGCSLPGLSAAGWLRRLRVP